MCQEETGNKEKRESEKKEHRKEAETVGGEGRSAEIKERASDW
jgi:hypothetical protein